MYIDRFVDRDRNRTTNRFFCPCGVDLALGRELDLEHDLLPFPRPPLPSQYGRDEWTVSKAELLEMLREVVDELLDQRLGGAG